MKRIITLFVGALLLTASATAQQRPTYQIGGALFSNDAMSTSDLFTISQQQFNFGTARSMAMGGAFTSLGADQASMIINPAGLGMYRSGEVTFTPMVSINSASTENTNSFLSNSKTRMGVGNFGVVFNIKEGSGKLLSFNMGFSFNRVADYNYNYSYSYFDRGGSSIADAMSVMLEAGGVGTTNGTISQNGFTNWGIDPFFWPAVAGYKTYLVDQNSNGVWYPGEIGNNADIEAGVEMRSRGSANEFTWAMGGNINNKLYFGLSLGLQSISRRVTLYYGEAYTYGGGNGYDSGDWAVDADGNPLPEVMQSMGMQQTAKLSGVGVNFKLGFVYRPTPSLRLGVALHTPTLYSLDRTYDVGMSTVALGQTSETDHTTHTYTSDTFSELLEDSGPNSWDFASPTRLMLGASYTFGPFAVLSIDYERSWYNGIRVKNQPYLPYGMDESDFKQDFKNYFQGSDNLRVGVELRPIPQIALRAGYGYSGSMLKEKNTILAQPAVETTNYYTAGLGFTLGKCFIDVAYCYSNYALTEYMLFYGNRYQGTGSSAVNEIYESPRFKTELNRHNVALTLGVKF